MQIPQNSKNIPKCFRVAHCGTMTTDNIYHPTANAVTRSAVFLARLRN